MIAIDPGLGCCACVSNRISELLDGELDARIAPWVALHVATCPSCGRIAAQLAELVAAMHTLSPRPWAFGSHAHG